MDRNGELAGAKRRFVEILSGMSSWGGGRVEPDVQAILTELVEGLDEARTRSLGAFILAYLAEHGW